MNLYYPTKYGNAEICHKNGRYHASFSGYSVGRYHSVDDAASDISGARISTLSFDIDLAMLNIPADPLAWKRRSA